MRLLRAELFTLRSFGVWPQKGTLGKFLRPLRSAAYCVLPSCAGWSQAGAAGCLHARRRASPPMWLHTVKICIGEGLRSVATEGPRPCFLLSLHRIHGSGLSSLRADCDERAGSWTLKGEEEAAGPSPGLSDKGPEDVLY